MKIKFSNSGFSLVEVLIVLILLSGGFIILLQALITGKFMNAKAEGLTQQAVLLNNTIQEIRSRRFDENTTAPWSSSLGSDNFTDAYLSFDGNDDVHLGNNSSLNIRNNTTVMAWVRPNTYSGRQEIMTNDDAWYWEIRSNGNLNFERHGGSQVNCNNCLTHNEWQHIAIVRDGSNLHMYINAQVVASSGVSGTFNNISYGYYIGQHGHDNTLHYTGAIDDVSVWNIALTHSQIQNYMTTNPIGNESGLVGFWPLDENQGTTTNDQSSSGNNGTINGATWGSQSSSESTISGWDDIDDFNLYSVSEIPNYTAFGCSVKVRYVQSSSGFHSAITGPSDYKRVMVEINHKTLPALRDTFIVSPGL